MRPTNALFGDMPGRAYQSGLLLWWGDQSGQRMKGVYQYTLSPYQAKAAPNMFRNYLFNGIRLPAGIYYYIWRMNVKDYHWRNSKEGLQALSHEHEE
ncbi:hypothetical protein B0H11DRAFT_1982846 [Mycena galericulata]|nr:hypothetical protein B0H11DRAFT_1982846 [Mycena galericulata]